MAIEWHDWFAYDETSPSCLRWKVNRVSGRYKNHIHVAAGDIAGSLNTTGYYLVKLNYKFYCCHRIIVEMFGACLEKTSYVDHINGIRSDNRIENLRVVIKALNARNIKKRKDNTSGKTGVTKVSNRDGNTYWSGRCEDGVGGYIHKRFSIARYGNDEAFRLACEFRDKTLRELNEQGAGYTERHGK